MTTASVDSTFFVAGLNSKFASESDNASNYFDVIPGRRFDRIIQGIDFTDARRSVHAFVERRTGRVFKAAGWNTPASGHRYDSVDAALLASDLYGSYLYIR